MGDDAEAVIFEVSKAASVALDEFHFVMEALGDAVILEKRHMQAMGSAQERGGGKTANGGVARCKQPA